VGGDQIDLFADFLADPATDGREIRLRRVTTPSPEQNAVLGLLGITLPQRLDLNFECSVNSATG
jgi:hypothetical protein